ncbi:MAG: aromatic ring-hydroxylating dioxygenase subunit alpha [Gammaproteobacteria bacterium]|nr:aromatic ring-hydroxylating dioxygenase subunit alpha [Gammaproteobacteria bacterium]
MFINFWYAAELAGNVTDKPVGVRMLGHDFVLFRDTQGKVHCLSNVCAHRGAALADGKLKGDCIECPYHGWRYDADGICTTVPSLGSGANIPKRARVDSYPTVERYGLVFAFLGDLPEGQRPPIMPCREWGQDGWRATTIVFDWDFDYKRSLENALDPAHNEFVHTTHIDRQEGKAFQVPDLELINHEWGTGFHIEMPAPPMFEEKMAATADRNKPSIFHIYVGYHGISSFWTFIEPTPRFLRRQHFYETPVEPGRTRIFTIDMRNAMLDPADDARMIKMDTMVANEDGRVLRGLRPVLQPANNTRENLVPADKHVAHYREKVKEYEALGWRIDQDEIAQNRLKVVYAIPSPARRTSRNWTLESVPLLPAKKAAAGNPQVSTSKQ